MKSLLFIFLLLPALVFGQLLPGGEKERYEQSKDNKGGFGSLFGLLEVKGVRLEENNSLEFATRAGLKFPNFNLGLNANFRLTKTVEDPRFVNIQQTQAFFNFQHYGLFGEYSTVFGKKKESLLSLGTHLNLGFTNYEFNDALVNRLQIIDYYLILEPYVNYAVKVYDSYYLNFGVYYRKSFAMTDTKYPEDYFSGFGIGIGIKTYK